MTEPTLLLGGRIWTGRRHVDALAVENGRVVAAGTEAEARRAAPTGAVVHRLDGRLVLPGLVDAHAHLLGSAVHRNGVELGGSRDLPEFQRRLSAWAERHPAGPVIARGWDQEILREHRFPTAAELDRAVPDRAAVAFRVCGHAAVINSPAAIVLERGDSALGPPATSAESGVLREGELALLQPLLRAWIAANPETIASVLGDATRFGLTSIGAMNVERTELTAATSRPSTVELFAYPGSVAEAVRLRRELTERSDAHVVGVKRFLDGSLGLRTAALDQAYSDAPDTSGTLVADPAEIAREGQGAADKGLQLALHAIGDRAVASALDAQEALPASIRPRLEHASVLSPALLVRLARARPYLVVQPSFVESDRWIGERLGPERSKWTYPFRSLIELGLVVAGSSDAPVESLDPWVGMRDSMAPRRDSGGAPQPGQELSASAALRLYTTGAAAALLAPDHGHLEVGATADWVRTDAVSVESAIDRGSGTVREVWRRGEKVWSANDGPVVRPGRSGSGHGK